MKLFRILKVSEAASLALHTMVILADDPSKMYRTREIADLMNASKDHLAKVLKRLERMGLVKSTRGPRGGFRLGKKSDEVKLVDIYEAIEGPYEATKCLLSSPICRGEKCILGDLAIIEKQIWDHLNETKLSDLSDVCPNRVKEN